jgi:hypothetical protein
LGSPLNRNTGILEYWNNGIMGNEEKPLKPYFPAFPLSDIAFGHFSSP